MIPYSEESVIMFESGEFYYYYDYEYNYGSLIKWIIQSIELESLNIDYLFYQRR